MALHFWSLKSLYWPFATSVSAFNPLSNKNYLNLLISAAFSNDPFSDKISSPSPVKKLNLLTFSDGES